MIINKNILEKNTHFYNKNSQLINTKFYNCMHLFIKKFIQKNDQSTNQYVHKNL